MIAYVLFPLSKHQNTLLSVRISDNSFSSAIKDYFQQFVACSRVDCDLYAKVEPKWRNIIYSMMGLSGNYNLRYWPKNRILSTAYT